MINLFKNKKYLFVFFLLGFAGFLIYLHWTNGLSGQSGVLSAKTNLPVLSENELSNYNGENPDKPIYIALEGNVYDVTAGRKFYEPGGAYHSLAGKDSTTELKIFGGEIIKRKYPVVAILKK